MTDASPSVSRIVDNWLLVAIARVTMALFIPMAGVFAWIFVQWIDTKFDKVFIRIDMADTRLTKLEAKSADTADVGRLSSDIRDAKAVADEAGKKAIEIGEKIAAMDAANARGRQARDEQFAQVLARLDRLDSQTLVISNAISGLTAVLKERGKMEQ